MGILQKKKKTSIDTLPTISNIDFRRRNGMRTMQNAALSRFNICRRFHNVHHTAHIMESEAFIPISISTSITKLLRYIYGSRICASTTESSPAAKQFDLLFFSPKKYHIISIT